MELNRNQIFMVGMVLLLFGLQFRMVDSYVLNERASTFLESRLPSIGSSAESTSFSSFGQFKTVKPPEWLGWLLISTSTVLILHSLAMTKPGG